MNTETAITTTGAGVIAQRGDDLEVSAFTPQEMLNANQALILWCEKKIAAMKAEAAELTAAFQQAVTRKWKSTTLKRHSEIAAKRVTFYEKIMAALKEGFYIVPNFPVTCFAIRTAKGKPLALCDTSHWSNKEQRAESLPPGEGEHQNPFPVIFQRDISNQQQKAEGKKVMQYFAEKWDEFEFPVQMAKPHIMEATSRAMALKLFDDFGVLPGHTKADPIVVGRIKDPRSLRCNPRFVTFIIAWHLDTRML